MPRNDKFTDKAKAFLVKRKQENPTALVEDWVATRILREYGLNTKAGRRDLAYALGYNKLPSKWELAEHLFTAQHKQLFDMGVTLRAIEATNVAKALEDLKSDPFLSGLAGLAVTAVRIKSSCFLFYLLPSHKICDIVKPLYVVYPYDNAYNLVCIALKQQLKELQEVLDVSNTNI
jgi:hypothetical protein